MENAHQFSKVYPEHLDSRGEPSSAYWEWAARGWADGRPHRYPMGKGAKPAYCYWNGEHLDYIEARKRVYFPLYRDAVTKSPAMDELERVFRAHGEIALFDFDGYDHRAAGMTLADVIDYADRPMGHAFILAMVLLYGRSVTPEIVARYEVAEPVRVPKAATGMVAQ